MWKEKIKHRKKKKEREKKTHTGGGGGNGCLIFLLSVGDLQEILKFIFNAINCLMKHNNLPC